MIGSNIGTNATPAELLKLSLDGDPEIALEAIARLRHRLDEAEHEHAFSMRLRGDSWQHIANATGLNSRQAAQQRFGQSAGLLDALAEVRGRTPKL